MGKGRKASLFFFFLFFIFCLSAQTEDSLVHKGFTGYAEAADTIYARLIRKKYKSIREYTVSEAVFISETRKKDTAIPYQMIRGQYLSYWGRVERTFGKVRKKLQRSKVSQKKAHFDTVLVYRNTGNPDLISAEIYFSQKKYRAYVKYKLWRVDGLWYLTDRIQIVEERIKK